MIPPQAPGLLISRCLSIVFAVVAGIGLLKGAPINEIQHRMLPRFENSITFVSFKDRQARVNSEDRRFNPGGWSDVRIVALNPPLVTISGFPHRGRGFLSEEVHLMCFPAVMRTRLAQAAAAARPILEGPNDPDALLLKDGTVLPKASVASATPDSIVIEYAGGSRTISPAELADSFRRSLGVTGKFVYVRELALEDGRQLSRARIVASDSEQCRITHEAGNLRVPVAALPTEARALVTENLIHPGLFAAEVVTDPDLLVKRAAHPRGKPVPTPAPTPVPPLQKSGFHSYAVLPLANGTVLRDARIVSVGIEGASVVADGSTRFVSKDLLPDEVYRDAGGALAPMLQELLTHGVVAKSGSPIFELAGRNASSGDFGEAAKDARGGRMLARVGPGYLLMEGHARDFEGGAVQFPKPLGSFSRGYVTVADFAHLGPPSWRAWWLGGAEDPLSATLSEDRDRGGGFTPVEPGKDTLLLDPFEARYTLFGNDQNIMLRAWHVGPALKDGLAIVETKSGFYLGVLAEKSTLPESRMAWPELLAHRSGGYTIEKTGQRQLQPGSTVFQTNSLETNPERLLRALAAARLLPEHYRTLIDRGIESTRLHMETGQAENVEMLPESTGDFSRTKEVEVEKVGVQFRSVAAGMVVLQVVLQQREREVERTYGKDSQVTAVSKSPWKSRKVEKTFELETDVDGGLRLLDGETLYELTFPKVGGYLLSTYSVKANALSRPPR